jgi:HSP20 family protein
MTMNDAMHSTRNPYGEMRGLLQRMDEVFRDFDGPRWSAGTLGSTWPIFEARDEGDEIVLRADIPGISEEELSIDATQESLTIRGARNVRPPQGYTAHHQERRSLRFSRSFDLPCRVDLEGVQAMLKDGVLTVRATKLPEARPKQISVRTTKEH